ncbi:actin-related protein 1 KNAG_0H03650 [Huiozyma naganishii CBS 8797]|uniref:Actin-2 n=1 Tax=Huiozyma naganishii (strain ATCC MYA-139 / BCRC 22969 / CBS 8797 / KCTC 17520 / NBRC 10181 / NCYC 3082 / Yp74L-3) TaxID=1071383 RepID=J7S8W4_HUIN7|nr:hypothetical protein KNAG_0H03650 [Kazachstania naganishii CBS 8797]CCK71779.1 hypothetical protein KNAG_0H03650 [Kazachstania naganishii CBS 8797]
MADDSFSTLYNQPVVLDNGSAILKAGFSGDETPAILEYTMAGKPRYKKVMTTGLEDRTFVGNEAQRLRGLLALRRPISRGEVTNWDDMELLWSHIFYSKLQLGQGNSQIGDHPLLITEAPLNSTKNRETMCEILYETFNFDALYVAHPAVLSLYATGQTTGCVLECGEGYSASTPVYQGFALPSSIRRIDIGGRDITQELQFYIRKSTGLSLFSNSEQEIVRTIKEKANYVALDYKFEEEKFFIHERENTSTVKLPDGQELTFGKGKYRTSEILFQPQLIGSECVSVPEMLLESINKVDMDLRTQLLENIVLSGGTTMLKGFDQRTMSETKKMLPKHTKVKIRSLAERSYIAWIGGSILSGLYGFRNLWLTREMYEEDPSMVHRKFL